MITLNDKVYEVEIEEVMEPTGEEKITITQNSNIIPIDDLSAFQEHIFCTKKTGKNKNTAPKGTWSASCQVDRENNKIDLNG